VKYIILLLLLASSSIASARGLAFAWDANPPEEQVAHYDLEIFDEGQQEWISVGLSATTTLAVPTFPAGVTRCRVSAINTLGIRGLPGAELVIPANGEISSSPTGLRATLIGNGLQLQIVAPGPFVLQSSIDLHNWEFVMEGAGTMFLSEPLVALRKFYRVIAELSRN
jgi:hypothetical protein